MDSSSVSCLPPNYAMRCVVEEVRISETYSKLASQGNMCPCCFPTCQNQVSVACMQCAKLRKQKELYLCEQCSRVVHFVLSAHTPTKIAQNYNAPSNCEVVIDHEMQQALDILRQSPCNEGGYVAHLSGCQGEWTIITDQAVVQCHPNKSNQFEFKVLLLPGISLVSLDRTSVKIVPYRKPACVVNCGNSETALWLQVKILSCIKGFVRAKSATKY